MAKITKRDTPTELQHARIYLDDLEEIERVLRDAAPEGISLTFTYGFDGEHRYTSVADLEEFGGESSDFTMKVSSEPSHAVYGTVFWLKDSINPHVSYPIGLESHEWTIFAKLEQIFKARQDRVKQANDLLRFPFGWKSFFVCLLLFSGASFIPGQAGRIVYAIVAVGVIGLPVLHLAIDSRKNRIYFRYSRADRQESMKERRERQAKLKWLFVGAVIAAVVKFLVDRFGARLAK